MSLVGKQVVNMTLCLLEILLLINAAESGLTENYHDLVWKLLSYCMSFDSYNNSLYCFCLSKMWVVQSKSQPYHIIHLFKFIFHIVVIVRLIDDCLLPS